MVYDDCIMKHHTDESVKKVKGFIRQNGQIVLTNQVGLMSTIMNHEPGIDGSAMVGALACAPPSESWLSICCEKR